MFVFIFAPGQGLGITQVFVLLKLLFLNFTEQFLCVFFNSLKIKIVLFNSFCI